MHTAAAAVGRSYIELAMTIFYADSIDLGEDPEEKLAPNESLRVTPFDNFVYLPTAQVLMKLAKFQEVLRVAKWPPPIPPMRFSNISRPELLQLPGMAELEEADRIPIQTLLDLFLKDDNKEHFRKALASH